MALVNENNLENEKKLENKIQIVLGQTDYTRDKAKELLLENNYDEIRVIKLYLNINTEPSSKDKKSLNQQIYTQLREKLKINTTNATKIEV